MGLPLFFSTSRLGVGLEEGWGGSLQGDDGRRRLGLGGDGHSLDVGRNEVGGCKEVVSAIGTRRGDPLGGVLFALGHQQAVRAIAMAFPDW